MTPQPDQERTVERIRRGWEQPYSEDDLWRIEEDARDVIHDADALMHGPHVAAHALRLVNQVRKMRRVVEAAQTLKTVLDKEDAGVDEIAEAEFYVCHAVRAYENSVTENSGSVNDCEFPHPHPEHPCGQRVR